jgi:hypothetical protein
MDEDKDEDEGDIEVEVEVEVDAFGVDNKEDNDEFVFETTDAAAKGVE